MQTEGDIVPWKRNRGGGYRTARGGNVKRPKQYESLRKKGMSKRSAARIANSPGYGRRKGRKKGRRKR